MKTSLSAVRNRVDRLAEWSLVPRESHQLGRTRCEAAIPARRGDCARPSDQEYAASMGATLAMA